MKNQHLLAAGGLIILIIISIGILIERLTAVPNSTFPDDFEEKKVLPVISSLHPDIESVADKNFEICMIEHSKSPYFPATEKVNELLSKNIISIQVEEAENFSKIKSTPCMLSPGKCVQDLVINFNNFMKTLDMRLILMEPSVLFCMLPQAGKFSLLMRGFSLRQFKDKKFYSLEGSRNVMTFGIFYKDAEILEKQGVKSRIISAGYKIYKFPHQSLKHLEGSESVIEPYHYLFIHFDMMIHLIVLYPKNTYLWYPSFISPGVDLKGLLFLDNEIFENFTTAPLQLNNLSTKFYTPTTTRHFLLEIVSSEYTECKNLSSNTTPTARHLPSNDSAKDTLSLTITELKYTLSQQMVVFWLWGKSLLGWFEECDIFHYSTELELSIRSKNLEILTIPMLFNKSDCKILETNSIETNKYKMDCYGLHVTIIMQEGKRIVWYEDKEQNTEFTFPKYSLCSTDILGHKINVPCHTLEIVQSHEGQLWRNNTLNFGEEM